LRALRDACRVAVDVPASGTATADVPPVGASEAQVKAILSAVGLPVPEAELVADRADAALAVERLGGRAVFKAVVPGLLHKSDAGGVVIDVAPAGASSAFDQCASLGGEVLVERFVPNGVEVLVGITPSAMGRVLTVGVGGVLTEVVADIAVGLLPMTAAEIDALLDRTRVGRLLEGVRGAPPADRASGRCATG
jgi:acyl-CoA synthetase (NDP forming)